MVKKNKHVSFSNELVIHVIEIESRRGNWAEDSLRFRNRCRSVKEAISFVFDKVHRQKMRFIVNLSNTLRANITRYSLKK